MCQVILLFYLKKLYLAASRYSKVITAIICNRAKYSFDQFSIINARNDVATECDRTIRLFQATRWVFFHKTRIYSCMRTSSWNTNDAEILPQSVSFIAAIGGQWPCLVAKSGIVSPLKDTAFSGFPFLSIRWNDFFFREVPAVNPRQRRCQRKRILRSNKTSNIVVSRAPKGGSCWGYSAAWGSRGLARGREKERNWKWERDRESSVYCSRIIAPASH